MDAAHLPRPIPYLSPLVAVLGYQHAAAAGSASRDLCDSCGGSGFDDTLVIQLILGPCMPGLYYKLSFVLVA